MAERFCVCPSHATPKQCMEIRYAENDLGEECECACHEGYYDEQNEWYAEQLLDDPRVETKET